MTTPIKTQCPDCSRCFDVQQNQLNKVKATISCDQCQTTFLVNEHLIVTSNISDFDPKAATTESELNASSHDANSSSRSTQASDVTGKSDISANHKQTTDTLIHDGLIYDDMEIDDPDENDLEYDSLDSMDAWLNQVDSTDANDISTQPSKNTLSKDINDNDQYGPSSVTTKDDSIAQKVLSSAAANDINVSIDKAADDSWLEQLLKEQHKREEPMTDNTDLSKLLRDMGVPLNEADEPHRERMEKTQASFHQTPATRSIATILWTLGCLVLALLLAAQYVIFNLETLVKNPVNAERLQTVCAIAACGLPSANLTALAVTSPNHTSSQIKTTGNFSDVGATLTNQSAQAQLYPDIKVSVYGDDGLIGEFIASPQDYLLGKQSQLAANSDRRLLFTVPVADEQIRDVTMMPFY